MQHTNAILERIFSDVKKLKVANSTISLHSNMVFASRSNITNISIKKNTIASRSTCKRNVRQVDIQMKRGNRKSYIRHRSIEGILEMLY